MIIVPPLLARTIVISPALTLVTFPESLDPNHNPNTSGQSERRTTFFAEIMKSENLGMVGRDVKRAQNDKISTFLEGSIMLT